MQSTCTTMVSGLFWRFQIVPLCDVCGEDMRVECHRQGTRLSCQSCDVRISRGVRSGPLLQIVLEAAVRQIAAENKTPPIFYLEDDPSDGLPVSCFPPTEAASETIGVGQVDLV